MNKSTKILIAITTFILSLAITLQVRSMKSTISQSFANDELRDSLFRWKEKQEKAEKELDDSTKKLEKLREEAASSTSNSETKTEELKKNNMYLGASKVKGNGLTITLKDSKVSTSLTEEISAFLVHDSDLRELVSELSNAGAQAIEINGERIVFSTCITCAGNVISINGNRVSSPFVIKAIGNQESLYGSLTRPGSYIALLKNVSIQTDVKKTNNIEISKYPGTFNFEYMKNIQ